MDTKKVNGFSRVTKTTAGKTHIGMEVEVNGMTKKADLSEKQYAFFISRGYRYMMPKYENRKLVRLPFFYKSFSTEEERENEYKVLVKKLVSEKKPEAEAKKPETEKSLMKHTKAELVEMIIALR